jgi:hypothetical protein
LDGGAMKLDADGAAGSEIDTGGLFGATVWPVAHSTQPPVEVYRLPE